MLKENKLLIDKDCPMCVAYGSAFTKLNLIDKETLSPYQFSDCKVTNHIDMDRASSEIALLDTKKNEVKYGIDAMIHIVSHEHNWFNQILNFPLFYFPLKVLYKFISYNRKVITGHSKVEESSRECEPDFHLAYLMAYIVLGLMISCFSLLGLASYFEASISWPEMLKINISHSLVLFGLSLPYGYKKAIHYLGNWQTINIVGALLALPFLIGARFIEIEFWPSFFFLIAIVLFMFYLHFKRSKAISVHPAISLTWLIYVISLSIYLFN